ncbi:uncharacterized protein LOC144438313 [Glandiceps talaboti]
MGCTVTHNMATNSASETRSRRSDVVKPSENSVMSFDSLVQIFTKSLQSGTAGLDNNIPTLADEVYGRICTTMDTEMPNKLSFIPGRKTAFVFGPETITNSLLSREPYHMLTQLGYLPEYIHLKVCKENRSFWLVLFLPQNITVVPATWDGVLNLVKTYYPKAEETIREHLPEIKIQSVEFYEEQAGMKFIDAIKEPPDDNYMSYDKYVSLEKPVKSWQTRLFLYCELRLLELFQGNGYTKFEDGTKGEKEFICPNIEIKEFGENNYVILPMKIVVPDEIKLKYDTSI